MEGTWKTSGGSAGGGTLATVVGVIIAAAVAIKYVVVPVVNLAVEIIKVAFVSAGVLLLLAVAMLVTYRVRRGAFPALRVRTLPAAQPVAAARTVRAVPPDSRAAIGAPAPAEVHTHIHVHLAGQSAEADAAAVRALTERAG